MDNTKYSLGQLSKILVIPKSSVYRRIQKLESNGIIKGYSAKLDHNKIGKLIIAFILISINSGINNSQESIARKIARVPEVYDIHIITGEYDMIAKVRTSTVESLGDLVVNKIRKIKGSYTFVVDGIGGEQPRKRRVTRSR